MTPWADQNQPIVDNISCSESSLRTHRRIGSQVVANLGQEIVQLGGTEVADTIDDTVATPEGPILLPVFDEVPGVLHSLLTVSPNFPMCVSLRRMFLCPPAARSRMPVVP